MDENYLHDYDVLKAKIKKEVHRTMVIEKSLVRRVTVSYFDAGKIGKMILKDTKKYLMTYDSDSGGIIVAVGRYTVLPNQFIYGIQPYLHIEYSIKILIVRVGAKVKVRITGASKGTKLAGEIFEQIPAIVTRAPKKDTIIGRKIYAKLADLIPTHKGPCAAGCSFLELIK